MRDIPVFEPVQKGVHFQDGVDAQVGHGTVSGFSCGFHLQPQDTPMSTQDFHPGRLGDNNTHRIFDAGLELLDKPLHAATVGFFTRGCGEDDPPFERLFTQIDHGRRGGTQAPQHIRRTPADDFAVLLDRTERVGFPVVLCRRDDIQMGAEQ